MTDQLLQDSGQRQVFPSGAVRDIQAGKGRFDLLPPSALLRIAKQFEHGATKYGERNWERGIPLSRFLDSALRHVCLFLTGRQEEDHLVAAAWNLLAALETESRAMTGQVPVALLDIGPYGAIAPEPSQMGNKDPAATALYTSLHPDRPSGRQ